MEVTRVATLKELARDNWKVWRITTKSGSTYHVGLRDEAGRRMAVLRGVIREDGARVEIHDRDPRLDNGALLFELAASQWVGHCLAFGTAETSRIVRVQEETDDAIVTSVTGVGLAPMKQSPRPRTEPAPAAPSYPENFIADVEVAAALVRRAYQKQSLPDDLRVHSAYLERMQVALSECALVVHAFGHKLAGKK